MGRHDTSKGKRCERRLHEDGGALVGQWVPSVDVVEDTDAVQITAEPPGVKPEGVKIPLENNVVTIRGEKRQGAEEKADRVHRYERRSGAFERAKPRHIAVKVEAAT